MNFPQNEASVVQARRLLGAPDPSTVLLDVNEVARRLSVSRKTVFRLIGDGELPALRLGTHRTARRRITEADLLAFIESRRSAS